MIWASHVPAWVLVRRGPSNTSSSLMIWLIPWGFRLLIVLSKLPQSGGMNVGLEFYHQILVGKIPVLLWYPQDEWNFRGLSYFCTLLSGKMYKSPVTQQVRTKYPFTLLATLGEGWRNETKVGKTISVATTVVLCCAHAGFCVFLTRHVLALQSPLPLPKTN